MADANASMSGTSMRTATFVGSSGLTNVLMLVTEDSGDFVHAVRSFRTPQSEAAERPTLSLGLQPLSVTSFGF
jgi:hypothetical protein